MWQRFTELAKQVIFFSQEEAQKFGDDYVSTEHILLGLCRDSETVAGRILRMMNTSTEVVRQKVEAQLSPKGPIPSKDMTLTPRAKRCIDLAYEEARLLGNTFIGTEHLLLGLVREGQGVAGVVLAQLEVDLEKTRTATVKIQAHGHDEADETSDSLRKPQSPTASYDLQLLHPVDQLLLAMLTDSESDFGKGMKQRAPNLLELIPSIVVTMGRTARHGRIGTQGVIHEAQLLAAKEKRHELRPEDIYLACIRHTTEDIRSVLTDLGLNPFRKDDLEDSE